MYGEEDDNDYDCPICGVELHHFTYECPKCKRKWTIDEIGEALNESARNFYEKHLESIRLASEFTGQDMPIMEE